MEKGETGQGNTGTPAANAAIRKMGNTPGSQRSGREGEAGIANRDTGKSRGGYAVFSGLVTAVLLPLPRPNG